MISRFKQHPLVSITFITVLIHIALGMNVIWPSYETIPYYQEQIKESRRKLNYLKKLNLQMQFHVLNRDDIHQRLIKRSELNQKLRARDTYDHLITQIAKKAKLEPSTMQITSNKLSTDIGYLEFHQELSGTYSSLLHYLKELRSQLHYPGVRSCIIKNTDLKSKNPILDITLIFRVYYFVSDSH